MHYSRFLAGRDLDRPLHEKAPRSEDRQRESWARRRWKIAQYENAAKRGLPFRLSLKQFDELTSQPCTYCGGWNENNEGWKFNGIDRLKNSRGYTRGNVVPACTHCNMHRGTMSIAEFIEKTERRYHHMMKHKKKLLKLPT